ncbi:MAG: cupin domain-containing protein [Bacteroidales bacterium]|nr:cupin domain-containing protein [Bacteroidales bacterium]
MDVKTIIEALHLLPHPEGGYYKETYRSTHKVRTRYNTLRSAETLIYFLLEKDQKSHFHRLQSDETWFFHQGESIEILAVIDGKLQNYVLGNNIENNESPQITIPAHTWFAAHLTKEKDYALVSCSVAPGFEFTEFEIADREDLLKTFPHLKDTILHFTL